MTILTPSLTLTQVETLMIHHQVVSAVVAPPPAAPAAPAPPVALGATPTLLTTIPSISLPHPSHSPAVTLMLLMKHGKIFIGHMPSPCTISGASCAQSSTPVSFSLTKLLSVAN